MTVLTSLSPLPQHRLRVISHAPFSRLHAFHPRWPIDSHTFRTGCRTRSDCHSDLSLHAIRPDYCSAAMAGYGVNEPKPTRDCPSPQNPQVNSPAQGDPSIKGRIPRPGKCGVPHKDPTCHLRMISGSSRRKAMCNLKVVNYQWTMSCPCRVEQLAGRNRRLPAGR